jgi:CRP-like cAMP-binding protein
MGDATHKMGQITLEHKLRQHDFAAGLGESQVATLLRLAHEVVLQEDELALADGEHSKAFYLLVSGSVAIELRTPRFVVAVQALGPGQVFGWSALLENQETLFQVRARERTCALRIDGAALQEACKADPILAAEVLQRTLQVVAGRVKAIEIRFAEMCGLRV